MNAQENSVRNLQSLYSVVVGVALSVAILGVITTESDAGVVNTSALPGLVAFVATLIPFYHGALRHLDINYIDHPSSKPGALLADFVILFVEGCFFVALAALISHPVAFAAGLGLLLFVDAAWAFLAYLAFTKGDSAAEVSWAWINIVTSPLMAALAWLATHVTLTTAATVAIAVLAVIRTVLDYSRSWSFYYPSQPGNTTSESPSNAPIVAARHNI